jgi:hypothetical protein
MGGGSAGRQWCALVAVAAAVSALVVVAPRSGAAEGDPPLVVEGDVVDIYSSDPSGVRVDELIVWICAIEAGGTVPPVALTAEQAADVLQTRIAPYYEWLSEGAYVQEFTAGGTLPAGTNNALLADCTDAAMTAPASAGYAGAVVITNATTQNAFTQSGHKACTSPPCTGPTTLPANQRFVQLAAQNVVPTSWGPTDLATPAHELGHSIDWGHAGPPHQYRTDEPGQTGSDGMADPQASWLDDLYSGLVTNFDRALTEIDPGLPGLDASRAALGSSEADCNTALPPTPQFTICSLFGVLEYGDVTDVMAVTPTPLSDDRGAIPQTQVFNRYAAGWVPDEDVEVHRGEGAIYDVAPIGVAGTQMLVLPTGDDERYFTIEARADTPFLDAADLRPGAELAAVEVHVVDQRTNECGSPDCWGDVAWKTMMPSGTPWTFAHVLEVGESTVIEGVSVEVLSVDVDGTFSIQVGEIPEPPQPARPTMPGAVPATPAVTEPSFTG